VRRIFGFALLAAATTVITLAAAQPKGRGRRPAATKPAPKPAAPPAKPEAGAVADEPAPTGAGDAAAPAPPPPEPYEGGVRPSPLNPQPAEMPSAGDAGVPIDYDRLLADIAALRARVAAVADNLYRSRIAVGVQTDTEHAKIAHLTVSLDDGVVFTAPQTFAASDMTTVYDHAVAPGRHAVTVDVDKKDDRDEAFRTTQKTRFAVDVPKDHRVEVEVRVIEDSTMGRDFPGDRSGKYDLRVRVRATAKPVSK
jgi:hypothetical protein